MDDSQFGHEQKFIIKLLKEMMNHHPCTLMWHVSLAKCEKDLDDKIQLKKKCFQFETNFQ